MGALSHLIVVAVVAVVFVWLWRSSLKEQAKFEEGRMVFPATRALRILTVFMGLAFTAFFIWCWYSPRKPEEWWVPYLFLGFLALDLCIQPPVLSIEVDGIASRSWLGHEKKIRWEEIAGLRYNTGNNQFVVLANDGRKITHAGFNVDQVRFQREIRKRTRLSVNVKIPGTWKAKTVEVPHADEIAEEEE
jgi:hypothetical protein